ncbi:hypothetical protein [Novosphingobium sp. FSW06-99]|uniref:hypothetical protein n=1 Tax=Novosphingobium sp. FSW06-99 TaxID=1739113 RepID=UPI00076C8EDA|nr:hypothetical protein [Novosphingobium sp. FSW06-99]KUR80930.1 hypothetical protein AQZ49_02590 [Novosphingobium sp. FSW06-99]
MASRSPIIDPCATTCTLFYIRRELGQSAMSERRMIVYLRQLIAQHDFPRPLPLLLRDGTLTTQPHRRSAWIKSAVDAWLAGFIPPDCGATLDDQAHRAAAAEMDNAAAHLHLVGGRDYRGNAA